MGQIKGKIMLTTFLIAIVVLVLLFVMMSVKIVHQGYRYTIEHFGRFVRVAQPGFNFVPPFFYRVGHKINMMEQVVDIPGQEIITKDNAMVAVDGVVFFQVLDAAKAAYEVSDLYMAIMALSTTNLRTVMGSMDLDETLSKRDEINARLLERRRPCDRGVGGQDHPRRTEGHPPAGRHRQRHDPADEGRAREARHDPREPKARGRMKSTAPRARSRRQILEAEGRKEAAFRDAEARERSAEAEANATKSVSDAIEGGSVQAINYFIAQKYVEAIGMFATSPNAKTILFPVEATQLMGTLGGIGELAREAIGDGMSKAATPGPSPTAPSAARFPASPACRGSRADVRRPRTRLDLGDRRRGPAHRRSARAGLLPAVRRRRGDRHRRVHLAVRSRHRARNSFCSRFIRRSR